MIGESTCYLGNNYSLDTPHFLMYNMIGGIGRALGSTAQEEGAVTVGNELFRGFTIYLQKKCVIQFILVTDFFPVT